MIVSTESKGGTGADEPVEHPGAPGESDPTVERDQQAAAQQPTQAFQQLPPEEPPSAEQPDLPVTEQPTQEFEQLPREHPATEPPVNQGRQTEQFASTPVDAPWTPQAPPTAGRPSRRRPGTGVLVGVGAAIIALVAIAALALPSLTGDDQPTTASTAVTPTTAAAPSTAPSQTTVAPTTQPVPVAGTVQVVRSGFTQLPPEPDGDVDVSYAVVLRNPRNDQVAQNVRVIVTFTGANGAVVETKDEELDALLPGQTAAVADTTGVRGARRMRVQILVGGFAPGQGLAGKLSASGVRTSVVAGELITTATVRSTLGQPLSGADVVAVYYDRSGRIIGGQSDSVDAVPAGGAVPVRLDSSTNLRGIAKTEVHASPKDLVPGG
jgi:hypothetical protein